MSLFCFAIEYCAFSALANIESSASIWQDILCFMSVAVCFMIAVSLMTSWVFISSSVSRAASNELPSDDGCCSHLLLDEAASVSSFSDRIFSRLVRLPQTFCVGHVKCYMFYILHYFKQYDNHTLNLLIRCWVIDKMLLTSSNFPLAFFSCSSWISNS